MFTSLTLSAVSVLHAISIAEVEKPDPFPSPETPALLDRLVSGGFIRLTPGKPCGYLNQVTRTCLSEISVSEISVPRKPWPE